MTSPFPGMDPYLEAHWGDVHARLIIYASDQINSQLPGDLRARAEERLVVESPLIRRARGIRPDVRIIEEKMQPRMPIRAAAGVAVAEPLLVWAPDEPTTETFLKIIDVKAQGRVVTGIEILSLANKYPGDGREEYLKKQRELRMARVNSVEIDLLRDGAPVSAVSIDEVRYRSPTAYHVCVHRADEAGRYEVYPIHLRQRLPAIRIPLCPKDEDVILDLQAIVDQCYGNAGYDSIDYTIPPVPPLDPEDAAWADALLREKGLR